MSAASARPRIAHLVHPVAAGPGSDLVVAQPVTFASMRTAREFARGQADVDLFAIQYHDEERLPLPDAFQRTPDLRRSVTDVAAFQQKRKLALMRDLLDALYACSQAEYFLYTNVDIALQPHFYLTAAALIARGHDALIINRRTISGRFRRLDEMPLMYAEIGAAHRGWDCFLFARRLYPRFQLGDACVGSDWIGRMMIANMAPLARSFAVFKDLHATFHIGNDKAWSAGAFRDYAEHNKEQCRRTLVAFDKKYGPFDRKRLPGKFFNRFAGSTP